MGEIFYYKPNREFIIISIGMILFGLILFIVSIISFGKTFLYKPSTFIVIYSFVFIIITLGLFIFIGYIIERNNHIIVENNELYIYNGFNKLSLTINSKDIKEIIYCKYRQDARKYWYALEVQQRPYGHFKNDQIVISIKNKPIIQHIKMSDPDYVLLFLREPIKFINYMKNLGINTKMYRL